MWQGATADPQIAETTEQFPVEVESMDRCHRAGDTIRGRRNVGFDEFRAGMGHA
jgi:hypothetical protein